MTAPGIPVLTWTRLWRTHSCVPGRDSSRRKDAELLHSVHTSVNAARISACATNTTVDMQTGRHKKGRVSA